MNLLPKNQIILCGLDNYFNNLIYLYKNSKLPNKILFSGQKGVGKSTLSYHLINYIFSQNEEFSYNEKKKEINVDNKSFKLLQNGSHPNFNIIDIGFEKKNIDIDQIRDLIKNLNKSSFKNDPKFILIDNIEYLNKNSVNALLKVLEEPNDNTYFILINNNKKIYPTLKSRCLDFKISLSHNESLKITNKLLNADILDLIHDEYLDYYFTPGMILNLIQLSQENSIDLKNLSLELFLKKVIKENIYKKQKSFKYIIFYFVELLLKKKSDFKFNTYYYEFINKMDNIDKFNLDDESFFIDLNTKVLNG